MGLILPPWYFANAVDNVTGTPVANDFGTAFTANASNADGTAVSVLSSLAFDAHYLIVGVAGINSSTNDCNALMDVLSDPAGGTSWGSFIDDLVCGMSPIPSISRGMNTWYHFPVFIKSGTSLGVQARNASASNITTGRVTMRAFGNPSRPEMWWCGQKVESLGINAASSKGTNVTPGDTGAAGTWTTIGTAGGDYGAVQFGVNGSDNNSLSRGYIWQIGYDSVQLPGSPNFYVGMSAAEESVPREGFNQLINCHVPNGKVMQAKATCSGTNEVFNAAIYGVY